jgi:predicted AAA+ superfamily ATPase
LKTLHFREDTLGESMRLHYVRDKERREVDFATIVDGKLDSLIEVKASDAKPSAHLRYFAERLRPKRAIQLLRTLDRERHHAPLRILQLGRFLARLET